ncbi:MAG: VanZ family protein [Anaerolineales bacterium]|jgi:VanZ family protein|nr:VanZ family protein [Anaerolineales bacterium]
MPKRLHNLPRWLPALIVMAAIFGFSSIPSSEMPRFGALDLALKKGGHMLGYALLALSLLHWRRSLLELNPPPFKILFLVWALASLYSLSDEFHQSFVPGRSANPFDLLIDATGAFLGLWLYSVWRRRKN